MIQNLTLDSNESDNRTNEFLYTMNYLLIADLSAIRIIMKHFFLFKNNENLSHH